MRGFAVCKDPRVESVGDVKEQRDRAGPLWKEGTQDLQTGRPPRREQGAHGGAVTGAWGGAVTGVDGQDPEFRLRPVHWGFIIPLVHAVVPAPSLPRSRNPPVHVLSDRHVRSRGPGGASSILHVSQLGCGARAGLSEVRLGWVTLRSSCRQPAGVRVFPVRCYTYRCCERLCAGVS